MKKLANICDTLLMAKMTAGSPIASKLQPGNLIVM